MKQYPVFVITDNHFDPIWRRCWQRPIYFKGERFVCYADLEEYYMLDHLALARQHADYRFGAESTVVARNFVRRHPELLPELRQLARDGRFKVTGAGDNIIDSNMVLGESIIRNFLTGLRWVEETLGISTHVGVRTDAFGNCAQLPQIFRGCEIAWVMNFSYSPMLGQYWRGLDGSTICTAHLPVVAMGSDWAKYTPCPQCHGEGCTVCGNRGIDLQIPNKMPGPIDEEKLREAGAGIVLMTPEELLPSPALPDWVKAQQGTYDIKFANHEDYLPLLKPLIDQVDDPPAALLHPGLELNPNNSGCLVTRIKLKHELRWLEYAMLEAETLCSLATLRGQAYPSETAAAVWEKLLFSMFHDAVTATHVDAAYEELKYIRLEADYNIADMSPVLDAMTKPDAGMVSVINTTGDASTQLVTVTMETDEQAVSLTDDEGKPVPIVLCKVPYDGSLTVRFVASEVPPLAVKRYQVKPSAPASVKALAAPTIENQRFRVTADEHGLLAIFDKKLGINVSNAGAYRPNEFILERDEGSPWATLHPDRARQPLAGETALISAEDGGAFQRLTFTVNPRLRLACCRGQLIVTLVDGIDRVDFAADVFWDTFSLRLRIAMPAPFRGKGIYGIPYGMIERGQYEPAFEWAGANGDWPAINWAGIEGDKHAIALLNRGLPSYAIEDGPDDSQVILLSVLRSPVLPTYLYDPCCAMTEYDGMRDAGHHDFKYALTAYDVPFADSSIVADAEGYNAGMTALQGEVSLPEGPTVHSDHVRLSALKYAEQGHALIARLFEYRGRSGSAQVTIPAGITGVARVNLLERGGATLAIRNGRVEVPMHGWEIATLRLEIKA